LVVATATLPPPRRARPSQQHARRAHHHLLGGALLVHSLAPAARSPTHWTSRRCCSSLALSSPTDLSGTNSSGRLRVPLGQQLVAPQHLALGGVVGAQDEVLARAAQLQRRRIRSISYTVDRTSGAGASAANTSASVRALGRGSPRPSPRERRHRIAAACLHW